MKRAPLFSALMLAGLLFAGCSNESAPPAAGGPPPADAPVAAAPATVEHGKEIFMTTCVACHGADAKGIKGLGKDLTASTFAKGLSDDDLVAFINRGRDPSDPLNTTKVAMPPKGGNPALTDQDIRSVAMYVHSLEK
jgi:disulfide bond formation protein DsbB